MMIEENVRYTYSFEKVFKNTSKDLYQIQCFLQ